MYEKLSFHLLVVHVLMRITSRRQKLYFIFRLRDLIFVHNVFQIKSSKLGIKTRRRGTFAAPPDWLAVLRQRWHQRVDDAAPTTSRATANSDMCFTE
jgi:hypothetical protein